MMAKVCRVLPLPVAALALLAGSNPLLYAWKLSLGVYRHLSWNANVITLCINMPIMLQRVKLCFSLPYQCGWSGFLAHL